jgi:tetratricopeptide (TPR) repeat protein
MSLLEPSIEPGTVVAERFVIERLAGAGGMGRVYAAQDRTDGSTIALKLLHGFAQDESGRFRREAEVLRALDHPGIVRYVAHGETRGVPFLAMEWLDGEDLGERIARGRVPIEDTIALARAVADALGAAHAIGIVHRDVKSSNVRLTARGPVLVDFGIARAPDFGAASITQTGVLIGTPLTMSPEQARGRRDVDARADVFSLGCVLYECITGVAPFAARSTVAVLARILLDEVAPLSSLREGVPPAVDAIVRRMLEKDPDARPPNAAAVRDLFDRFGAGLSMTPPAPERRGLSLAENRYATCVVLRAAHALDATMAADRTIADPIALRDIAGTHGALLEKLADGSIVAVVLGGTREEQAARGARCALALRDATGLATAVAAGRATTGAQIPVGDAIDRALAALELAEAGAVATDETTSKLLTGRFVIEGRGGRTRVVGASSGVRFAVRGRSTPFVGRKREVASLAALVDEALDEGSPRAALVLATAGLGKSRLALELETRVRESRPDARCVSLTADDALASSPNAFARALTRALARDASLAELPSDLAPFARDLAALELSPDDEALVGLLRRDSTARRARHARALTAVFDLASRSGLALILDDAQWIDGASASLIDDALASAASRGIAVVALARPEGTPLFSGRVVEELRLSALASRASEELARHILGSGADDASLAHAVAAAAGHPLLLEEILRAGHGEAGDDVVALVQGRIAQLEPAARLVLRAASVLGVRASEAAIASLVNRDRAGAASAIDACVRAELLDRVRAPAGSDPAVAFRHALMRDAAYSMLTEEDRALGHKLALAWLEGAGEPDRLVLAEHAIRAARTDTDRAEAADRLVAASHASPRAVDALAMLERAQKLGESAGSAGERTLATVARQRAFWIGREGARVAAGARLSDEITRGRAAGDVRTLVAALPTRAWIYAATGRPADAARDLDEAAALVADDIDRFHVLKGRSIVAFFLGDIEEAIQLTDDAVAGATALGMKRERATYMHNAAEWRVRLGRFDEAEELLATSSSEATACGEAAIVVLNAALRGYVRAVRVGVALPEAELDEMKLAGDRFGSVGVAWEEATVRFFHAHAVAESRNPERARAAFETLAVDARRLELPTYVEAAERALNALDRGERPSLR